MRVVIFHGSEIGGSKDLPISHFGNVLFDCGISMVEIREALSALRTSIASKGVGIMGPLDEMHPKAGNALLKSMEELPDDLTLALWAREEASILPTILSRASERVYLPGSFSGLSGENSEVLEDALNLFHAWETSDIPSMVSLTSETTEVLPFVRFLSGRFHVGLWEELREGLRDSNFNHDNLLEVLLRVSPS